MLLFAKSSQRGLHAPILLYVAPLVLLAAAVTTLLQEASLKAGIGGATCGFLLLPAVIQTRVLRIRDGMLHVRRLGSEKKLRVEQLALGIQVSYGTRGLTTYSVYASDGSREVQIADTTSCRRAERWQRQLAEGFLNGDTAGAQAGKARLQVEQREAAWRAGQREARAYVQDYYRSGRFARAGLLVLGIVLVYSVGMFWYTSSRGTE